VLCLVPPTRKITCRDLQHACLSIRSFCRKWKPESRRHPTFFSTSDQRTTVVNPRVFRFRRFGRARFHPYRRVFLTSNTSRCSIFCVLTQSKTKTSCKLLKFCCNSIEIIVIFWYFPLNFWKSAVISWYDSLKVPKVSLRVHCGLGFWHYETQTMISEIFWNFTILRVSMPGSTNQAADALVTLE
jgi:hypothetical protein